MKLNVKTLSLALILVSCVKISEPLGANTNGEKVIFSMNEPDMKSITGTRQSNGFSVIYISAVDETAGKIPDTWQNVPFWRDGNIYSGERYWNKNNLTYSIYASNTPMTFEDGDPEIIVTNKKDAVCSHLSTPSHPGINPLTFKHVFAKIGNVLVEVKPGCIIAGVTVSLSPKTSGKYDLKTEEWTILNEEEPTIIATTTPGCMTDNLILIPGEYELLIDWNTCSNNETTMQNRIRKKVNFDRSVATSICIMLGDNNEIKLKTEQENWDDDKRSKPILFDPSVANWDNMGGFAAFPAQ